MSGKLRVVHYLNQFFAGVGGEEKSDYPVTSRRGPLGPGALLDKILGEEAEVVATVFCGDGLFAENEKNCAAEAIALILEFSPDLVIAGPAFNAGRYGLACAAVCRAAQEAGILVLTAMHPENPGFPAAGTSVHTVPAADSAVGMEEALEATARLGLRLARGEEIGNAAEEGYLPRGIRYNEIAELPTSRRAVDMVLRKIRGEPYETELDVPTLEEIAPPEAIPDLKKARIAIVSEGGMVPPRQPGPLLWLQERELGHVFLRGERHAIGRHVHIDSRGLQHRVRERGAGPHARRGRLPQACGRG